MAPPDAPPDASPDASPDGVNAALLIAGRVQSALLVAVPKGGSARLLETLAERTGPASVVKSNVDLLSRLRSAQELPRAPEVQPLVLKAGLAASAAAAYARAVRAELDSLAAFDRAAPADPCAGEAIVVAHASSVRALHDLGLHAAPDREDLLSRALKRAAADRRSETHHVNVPPALDLTGYDPGYRWDFGDGELPLFWTPGSTTEGTPLPTNEGREEEFLCAVPLGPQCALFELADSAATTTLPGALVHEADGQRHVYVPCLLFVCDSTGAPLDGAKGGISIAMDGAAAVHAAAGATAAERATAALVLL